jgi:putative ABC transport system permease protein
MFKHIVRRLFRSPLFAAVTLLTLAIGIGANTSIFSVVRGILLKPLPYPDSERLVAVWETAPGIGFKEINASPATYFTFRDESRTFTDIGLWRTDSVSITGIGEPEQVQAFMTTDGVLPILGVPPVIGRWFNRTDDLSAAPGTVILSYGYWQRRFGGNPSVLGRTLVIDGNAHQIIGVMPRGFRFLSPACVLVLPLQFDRKTTFIGNFSYQAVARLKPGVTLAKANADVARMLPMMMRKFPPAPGMSMKMFEQARMGPSLRPLKQDVVGDVGSVLWVLMGTVGMVLFIACANVANLLLVRAEGRQQELAIRAALGAGWGQIARELLIESVTLALAGGLLGLGVAYGALRLLIALAPAHLPRIQDISIDRPVLLFSLGISLLAGVLFGMAPVFKYGGQQLGTALRAGGRTLSEGRERHRARAVLVVVQVALALVLLISSGLMLRTFEALRHVQPGFTSPDQILTLRISIPDTQAPKAEQAVMMEKEMAERVAALPGVQALGLGNSITMDGNSDNDPVFAQDHVYSEQQLPPIRRFKFISPGYFKAMGNPLIAGRTFNWTDLVEARQVVMVSENLARELWGSPSAALGKRIHETPGAPWREVIGVVGNEHDNGVNVAAPTVVYWPLYIKTFWQFPERVERTVAFVIRSSRAGTPGFLNEVRRAVWAVNPNLPVADVRTVGDIYETSMARTSFTMVMLALASGMALLLGVIGIYGVISYSVSQRTREIGIRMALGATSGTVKRMFVRHAMVLTAVGVVGGLAVSIGLTRLMTSLLYGVTATDPFTYCAVAAVLIVAALAASYLPARRATAVNPVDALRAQ